MSTLSWSTLPLDLLISIIERLETRFELMTFRAVCSTWRNSVPKSLLPSKNILSPLFPYKGNNHSSFLVPTSIFLIQSTLNPDYPPWLITLEEFNPGKLYLRAPLSRVIIKNLPVYFHHSLDLSQFHLQEMGRFYTLRKPDKLEDMFSERRLSKYDNKVVLFVNPNSHEKVLTIEDCIVVELYDHVDFLTVTRLRNGEKHQVYYKRREFDDIVSFNGRIYGVDYQGRVCYMDYHTLNMFSFIEDPLYDVSRSNYKKRFVVNNGDLYLIYRRCQKSDHNSAFMIFKVNEREQKWEKLKGIGDDKIIFVTFDGCFFGLVKDFPGWKGNCIVFRRGSFAEYSGLGEFDRRIFQTWDINLDVAVFHFDDGECVPIRTYLRYSRVIWPPPSWLWTVKGESIS